MFKVNCLFLCHRLAGELDSVTVHAYLQTLCFYQFTVDNLEHRYVVE